MKRIVLLLLGLLLALPQFAQERKYSTFYEQRATLFEELPVTSKDIIFGIKEQIDTITNRYNKWLYLFHISSC